MKALLDAGADPTRFSSQTGTDALGVLFHPKITGKMIYADQDMIHDSMDESIDLLMAYGATPHSLPQ